MKSTYQHMDPSKLKNHPLSIEIYGESLDAEFLESVKRAGRILEPLRVLGKGSSYQEGTVVSGRRRRMAAMRLGIKSVPVVVEHDLKDKLDIDEQVILSNRPNERTVEHRAREYAKLKEIEAARAAIRMKTAPIKARSEEQKSLENKDEVARKIFSQQLGKSSEIAASAVGFSRPTAEKAAEVVAKIDELEEAGKTEEAEHLRETLEENVTAAHREIEPPKKRTKKAKSTSGLDKGQLVRAMKKVLSQLVRLLDARGKGGNHSRCNKAINEFITAWDEWK